MLRAVNVLSLRRPVSLVRAPPRWASCSARLTAIPSGSHKNALSATNQPRRDRPDANRAQGRPGFIGACAMPAAAPGEGDGVQSFMLPPLTSPQSLEQDKQWLEKQLCTWLDEEWAPLEVHAQLAKAAADAYGAARQAGEDDMGGVLLSMSSSLLSFDFFDTFTDAFEVSNKAAEMLMLRGGCDVCCASDEDKARVVRVDEEFNALLKSRA